MYPTETLYISLLLILYRSKCAAAAEIIERLKTGALPNLMWPCTLFLESVCKPHMVNCLKSFETLRKCANNTEQVIGGFELCRWL